MSRVKRGFKARRRRNKVLKLAKGFHFSRRTNFRRAAETVTRALAYAFVGRKQLKRNMRALWIQRINAKVREFGLSYSTFISKLKAANIQLNRKMLAEMAFNDHAGFKLLIDKVKA